jgi:hypothetical protein
MKPPNLLLPVLLVFFTFYGAWGQDSPSKPGRKPLKSPIWEKIDLGGYLGAQFGTVTLIEISPLVTYRFTEKFHGGFGGTYQYYQDKRYQPDYRSSAYGVNLFARYFIWGDLFAHVEYAPVYITDSYYSFNGQGIWAHDFMIGGGYRQWIGDRAFATLMVLFNVNETPQSLYRNPIIKIGFGVGL